MFEFLAKNRSKVDLFLDESKLQEVLRRKKPTGYFWADMSDMFLDDYPFEWIDKCAATVALTPQHIHMWLTKRPERALEYITHVESRVEGARDGNEAEHEEYLITELREFATSDALALKADEWLNIYNARNMGWPLPNLFLGVSVESRDYKWRSDVLRKMSRSRAFPLDRTIT